MAWTPREVSKTRSPISATSRVANVKPSIITLLAETSSKEKEKNQKKIKDLTQQLASAEKEIDEKNEQLDKLKLKMENHIVSDCDNLNGNAETEEKHITKLKGELERCQTDLERVTHEKDLAEAGRVAREKEIIELKFKLEELETAKLKAEEHMRKSDRDMKVKLSTSIKDQERVDIVEKQLNDTRTELEELRKETLKLRASEDSLKTEFNKMKTEQSTEQREHMEENQDLEYKLNSSLADLSAVESRYRREIDNLNSQFVVMATEKENICTDLESTKQENLNLKTQLIGLRNNNSREIKKTNAQLAVVTREKDGVIRQLEETRQENLKLNTEISRLEAATPCDVDNSSTQLTEIEQERETLRQDLSAINLENQNIKTQLIMIQNEKSNEVERLSTQLTIAQKQVEDYRDEDMHNKKTTNSLKEAIKVYHNLLEAAKRDSDAMQTNINQEKAQKEQFKEVLDTQLEETEHLKTQLRTALNEKDSIEKEEKSLQIKYRELQNEMKDMEKQTKNAEIGLQAADMEIANLTREKHNLEVIFKNDSEESQKIISILQKEKSAAEMSAEAEDKKLIALTAQLVALETSKNKEIDQQMYCLARTQEERDNEKAKLDEAQKQIVELQQQNERVHREKDKLLIQYNAQMDSLMQQKEKVTHEKTSENDKLKTKLVLLYKEIDLHREKEADSKQEITTLTTQIDTLEKDLKSSDERHKAEIQNLTKEREKIQTNSLIEIDDLSTKIIRLERDLSDTHMKKVESENRNEMLRFELDDVHKQRQQEAEGFKAQMKETELDRKKKDKLTQQEVAKLTATLASMQKAKEKSERKLQVSEDNLKKLKDKNKGTEVDIRPRTRSYSGHYSHRGHDLADSISMGSIGSASSFMAMANGDAGVLEAEALESQREVLQMTNTLLRSELDATTSELAKLKIKYKRDLDRISCANIDLRKKLDQLPEIQQEAADKNTEHAATKDSTDPQGHSEKSATIQLDANSGVTYV